MPKFSITETQLTRLTEPQLQTIKQKTQVSLAFGTIISNYSLFHNNKKSVMFILHKTSDEDIQYKSIFWLLLRNQVVNAVLCRMESVSPTLSKLYLVSFDSNSHR